MAIEWSDLTQKHADLEQKLADPGLDSQERQGLAKEHSRLSELLSIHKTIVSAEDTLAKTRSDAGKADDDELKELYEQEIVDLEQELARYNTQLDDILYPPDERDKRSVFLEIRAGAGGKEAALFAGDLLKMYTNYAMSKNWQVSLVDSSDTDLGGFREVTLHIQGKNVFGHLKSEAGVHRVQRVPETEASGRVHTSTATVAVLPEAGEVDINVNPADLRIDTYRAGGAGGQHVNKTDSAVRITHIPTGVVVCCQDERSQHKNKSKAMKMLQSRLLMAEQEKHDQEISQNRKEMVGTGMRAEKVRTYNYPQNRVTDHQVNVTLKKLDVIVEGSLDEIIEPLMAKSREDRRKLQEQQQKN